MEFSNKQKIIIKSLKKFNLEDGDVLHALKSSEKEFYGFEEVYFSTIKKNKIKAWKKHNRRTMNLVVPVGKVQFIFYDEKKIFLKNAIIGEDNYSRITVPPKFWFGLAPPHGSVWAKNGPIGQKSSESGLKKIEHKKSDYPPAN